MHLLSLILIDVPNLQRMDVSLILIDVTFGPEYAVHVSLFYNVDNKIERPRLRLFWCKPQCVFDCV